MAGAIPQIGALPGVPSAAAGAPTSGAEMGQALGVLPQMLQALALQHAQGQQQLRTMAEQRLHQLQAIGHANPQAPKDAEFITEAKKAYDTLGAPLPMKNGAIDVANLAPQTLWQDLPMQDKVALMAQPRASRAGALAGVQGVPQGYLDAPMFNASYAAAIMRMMYETQYQQQTLALRQLGLKEKTSYQMGSLGERTAYQIGQPGTPTAGGILGVRQATLKERTRRDSAQIAEWNSLARYHTIEGQADLGRLQQGAQRLKVLAQNAQTMATRGQMEAFGKLTTPILTQYENALKNYTATNKDIQTAIDLGQSPNAGLLSTQLNLQKTLQSMAPLVNHVQTLLNAAPGRAAQIVTGLQTNVPPVPQEAAPDVPSQWEPVMTGTQKSTGKPVYSLDGGKTWLLGVPPSQP